MGPVVRGQDDDGRVFPHDLADAADRFDPVHIRHQPVHDIDFEAVSVAQGFLRPDDGFLPRHAPFAAHPDFPKHVGDALAGVDVVVHDQTAEALQFRNRGIGRLLVGDPEIHREDKFGPFALLRGDGDPAAHHLHDVSGDRHAEAGPLDPRDRGRFFPRERIEDRFGKLLAHADAVVPAAELECGIAGFRHGFLHDPQRDRAARPRVFDGVGDQIEPHLIEAQLVAVHELVPDVHRVDEEIVLFGLDVRVHDVPERVEDVRQRLHFLVQDHLAGFDAAHVQHVVDQREEMFRGTRVGRQILLNAFGFVDVACREPGEPDDRVHRRADVVGHIAQERRFGAVRRLRHLQGVLEFGLLLFELFPKFFLLLPLFLDGLGVFPQFPVESGQFLIVEPGADQGVLRSFGFFFGPELLEKQFLLASVEDRKQVQDDRKRGDENAQLHDGLGQHVGFTLDKLFRIVSSVTVLSTSSPKAYSAESYTASRNHISEEKKITMSTVIHTTMEFPSFPRESMMNTRLYRTKPMKHQTTSSRYDSVESELPER